MELHLNMLFWIFLGASLIMGTIGVYASLIIVASSLCFAFGFLVSLNHRFQKKSDEWWLDIHSSNVNIVCLSKTSEHIKRDKSMGKAKHKITGSSAIDEQLYGVLTLFTRDFVSSWYSTISSNQNFIIQVNLSIHQILVGISNRCKSTDWVNYLTTKFVDEVASHLRLFREAKSSLKGKKDGNVNIIDAFFNKEAIKDKECHRDNICLNAEVEKDYLSDLVEYLLYFLVPTEEFSNIAVRSAVVEIMVSQIFLPIINMMSNPDYVNSLIVWSCSDFAITSELFLNVIRTTNCPMELNAVRTLLLKEVMQLRSHDSGGRDEGTEVKQQIGSLTYLRQVIDAQLHRLHKGTETDLIGMPSNFDIRHLSRRKLFQLPLEAILKNSLTLDHFLRYMDSINCQHYVNFYLNIECWKAAVSEQLCAHELEKLNHVQESDDQPDLGFEYSAHDLSSHKVEAEVMYEEYMSEKANSRVNIDDSLVKRLILRFRSENIHETWFDEVQQFIFNSLKETDIFLPAFRRSDWYIRLLAELDLLRFASKLDDDESQSVEDFSEPITDQGNESSYSPSPATSCSVSPCHTRTSSLNSRLYTISANIVSSEIVRESNRSHAVYKIYVHRKDNAGIDEFWNVYRRYSEFYDFHLEICSKFVDLSSIHFPSKKMLNNLAAWFLEKRLNELNAWLKKISDPPVIQSHPGLQENICKFLDTSFQGQSSPNLAKRVENNLVMPIRVSVKNVSEAVKSVPDSVLSTVDGVVDGIYKKLVRPSNSKVPYNTEPQETNLRQPLDLEGEENIPLRIILLLMDEVFDLRSKDQWFRRRFVLFLRHILKAMFGDIVNRRIVEYVSYISSAEQVASYIELVKNSLWPNGRLAPTNSDRDDDAKLKNKVAARTCLLASISDEFKAILGSQTTSRGVLQVYECVQHQQLNKRFAYVLISDIVEAVFNTSSQAPHILKELISTPRRRSSRSQTKHSSKNARHS